MPPTGWFDGLTGPSDAEAHARAADYLRHGRGFVIEWWGLVGAEPGDHDLASSLELGDRASQDAARENAPDRKDGQDWLVTKAVEARPAPFVDLLSARRP